MSGNKRSRRSSSFFLSRFSAIVGQMSAKTVSPWGGETKEMSSAHVRPLNLKSMYCNGDTGCSISSTDLGLVDFDNGSSIACLTLLRQMGFWQEGSNLSVNQSKVCRMVEHPVDSISSADLLSPKPTFIKWTSLCCGDCGCHRGDK